MERRRKREYERPTMQVVELRRSAPLICASQTFGTNMDLVYEEEDF